MPPPSFDQHLGFGEAVEDLAVEQFVAKLSIEPQAGRSPTFRYSHSLMVIPG